MQNGGWGASIVLGDGDGALRLDMAAWCGTERRPVPMLDVLGRTQAFSGGLFAEGWLPVIQSSIVA